MNQLLEKLGSYQILTNLLPGAFLGLSLNFFFDINLPSENLGEDILIYYFIGLVVNRTGALIIEPFLKKIAISQLKFLYPLKTLVFPAFSPPRFGPFPSFFPL